MFTNFQKFSKVSPFWVIYNYRKLPKISRNFLTELLGNLCCHRKFPESFGNYETKLYSNMDTFKSKFHLKIKKYLNPCICYQK